MDQLRAAVLEIRGPICELESLAADQYAVQFGQGHWNLADAIQRVRRSSDDLIWQIDELQRYLDQERDRGRG